MSQVCAGLFFPAVCPTVGICGDESEQSAVRTARGARLAVPAPG